MSLIRVDIHSFRNLQFVKLDPSLSGFNFFYGSNGSGKTSLLEAVYYLSRGRSFRSINLDHLIDKSADRFSIFAEVKSPYQSATKVGVERYRKGDSKIRIAGEEETALSELTRLTPTLLINSNCHNLLDSGPLFRRKYLDWGAFYTSDHFLRTWKLYNRALKQRNAALRGQISRKELESWTHETAQSGLELHQIRLEVIQKLIPVLTEYLEELLMLPTVKFSYQPGWDETVSLADSLLKMTDKDLLAGYTQIGPHRADFKITINQTPAKDILSRGQQKLFVCAMILAQGALLYQHADRMPIYLIDDLPSELDVVSRTNLITLFSKQEAQMFLTAVERESVCGPVEGSMARMFHVERGQIKAV